MSLKDESEESYNGSFAQSASSRSSISRELARREVHHMAPTLGSAGQWEMGVAIVHWYLSLFAVWLIRVSYFVSVQNT